MIRLFHPHLKLLFASASPIFSSCLLPFSDKLLAHRRCPPPLPKGPGGRPRSYREESLLLIGLLRTLWRLSYADMHDWLKRWPALALACGLGYDKRGRLAIPSPAQQCRRRYRILL